MKHSITFEEENLERYLQGSDRAVVLKIRILKIRICFEFRVSDFGFKVFEFSVLCLLSSNL